MSVYQPPVTRVQHVLTPLAPIPAPAVLDSLEMDSPVRVSPFK